MLINKVLDQPSNYDPNFGTTVLLIPADDFYNHVTTDLSGTDHRQVLFGGAKGNFFSPFNNNNYSVRFDVNSIITIPDQDVIGFESNDWTVECWVYFTESITEGYIISNGNFQIRYNSGELYLQNTVNNVIFKYGQVSHGMVINTWYHVAFSSAGSVVRFHVNGKFLGYDILAYIPLAQETYIGDLRGYISNLRVVKNQAVYNRSKDYDPPTEPLGTTLPDPAVAKDLSGRVVLLTLQNKFLLDNSNSNNTVVPIDQVETSNFNPFFIGYDEFNSLNNSTTWEAMADPTGLNKQSIPYLVTMPENFGNNDFTVEAWIRTEPNDTFVVFFTQCNTNLYVNLYVQASRLYLSNNTTAFVHPIGLLGRQWNHVALVRYAANYYLYVNGRSQTVPTTSIPDANFVGGETFAVGIHPNGSRSAGTISNMRIVTRQALFIGDITVSTLPLRRDTIGHTGYGPLGGIDGRCLFLGFQNAAPKDNSMSGSIVNFGGISPGVEYPPAIDRTGKSSIVPTRLTLNNWNIYGGAYALNYNNEDLQLGGVADPTFTIEGWAYGPAVFLSCGSDIYNPALTADYPDYPYTWYFKTGEFGWKEAAEIDADTYKRCKITNSDVYYRLREWNHYAISVDAGAIKMYINGELQTIGGDTQISMIHRKDPLGDKILLGTVWKESVDLVNDGSVFFKNSSVIAWPSEQGHFGTNDFTVEVWYRSNAPQPAGQIIISHMTAANGGWNIGVNGSTGTFCFNTYRSGVGYTEYTEKLTTGINIQENTPYYRNPNYAVTPINDGLWHHLAVVRLGNSLTGYVDGKRVFVGGIDPNMDLGSNNTNLVVGWDAVHLKYLQGYLSSLRISNSGVYSGPFVPELYPIITTQTELKNSGININTIPSLRLTAFTRSDAINFAPTALTVNGEPESVHDNPFTQNHSFAWPMAGIRMIKNQALFDGNFTVSDYVVTKDTVGHTGVPLGDITGIVSLCMSDSAIDTSASNVSWASQIMYFGVTTAAGAVAYEKYPSLSFTGQAYLPPPFTYPDATLVNGDYVTWLSQNGAAYVMADQQDSTKNPGYLELADFTIEFWAWLEKGANNGNSSLLTTIDTAAEMANGTFSLIIDSDGKLTFTNYTNVLFATAPYKGFINQTWNNVTITRRSLTLNLYINGQLAYEGTHSSLKQNYWGNNNFYVGKNGGYDTKIGIYNMRIIKGQAMISSADYIPAEGLTPDTETFVFVAHANAFADTGSLTSTVVPSDMKGNVSVTTFSPFWDKDYASWSFNELDNYPNVNDNYVKGAGNAVILPFNLTAGSNVITGSDTTGLEVGMVVTSFYKGIPADTVINSIVQNVSITLSKPAQAPFDAPGQNNITSFQNLTFQDTPWRILGDSFTIDAWVYPEGNYNKVNYIVGHQASAGANPTPDGWFLVLSQNDGFVTFFTRRMMYASLFTPAKHKWTHIAVSWNQTDKELFLWANGKLILWYPIEQTSVAAYAAITSNSTNFNLNIGSYLQLTTDTRNTSFKGNLSNIRIIKGQSIYKGIPAIEPTEKLTVGDNTTFLAFSDIDPAFDIGPSVVPIAATNDSVYQGTASASSLTPFDHSYSMRFTNRGHATTAPTAASDIGYIGGQRGDFTIEFYMDMSVRVGLGSGIFISVGEDQVYAYWRIDIGDDGSVGFLWGEPRLWAWTNVINSGTQDVFMNYTGWNHVSINYIHKVQRLYININDKSAVFKNKIVNRRNGEQVYPIYFGSYFGYNPIAGVGNPPAPRDQWGPWKFSNFRITLNEYLYGPQTGFGRYNLPTDNFTPFDPGVSGDSVVTTGVTGHVSALTTHRDRPINQNDYGGMFNVQGYVIPVGYNSPFSNKPNSWSYFFAPSVPGIGAYVDITPSAPINVNADFTFEFWVYTRDIASTQTLIDSYLDDIVDEGNFKILIREGNIVWHYNGAKFIASILKLEAYGWYHLAFQRTDNVLSILVNGLDIKAYVNGTGGDITRYNNYAVHTFKSQQYFYHEGGLVDILMVGGGGGGGYTAGGGGGAGGLIYNTGYNLPAGRYLITPGAGGTPGLSTFLGGLKGTNTTIVGDSLTIVALGGGGGGSLNANDNPGGSAGGAGYQVTVGYKQPVNAAQQPLSTYGGYGFNGGSGTNQSAANAAGGGGGGGAAYNGHNAGSVAGQPAGNGGHGRRIGINGTPTYYAGGGGGGSYTPTVSPYGTGGLGGGGTGSTGVAFTGGGGSGGKNGGTVAASQGFNGGSGIVIIRYVADETSRTFTGSIRNDVPIRMGNTNQTGLGPDGLVLNQYATDTYISNFRINATSIYTSTTGNFHPNVAPLSNTHIGHTGASIDTNLTGNITLLSFTNKDIVDASNWHHQIHTSLDAVNLIKGVSPPFTITARATNIPANINVPDGYQSMSSGKTITSGAKVTNSQELNFGTDDFTMEFWTYPRSLIAASGELAPSKGSLVDATVGYLEGTGYKVSYYTPEFSSTDGTTTNDGLVTYTFITSANLEITGGHCQAEILIVGGGGGGGGTIGGGGGAGGLIHAEKVILKPGVYPIKVGSGGVGGLGYGSATGGAGSAGTVSSFNLNGSIYTASGGGGGATYNGGSPNPGASSGGRPGGSSAAAIPSAQISRDQFVAYGYAGGTASASAGGGGGGAGGRGNNANTLSGGSIWPQRAGNGGAGKLMTTTGDALIYAAGGGGGSLNNTPTVRNSWGFGGEDGLGGYIGGNGSGFSTSIEASSWDDGKQPATSGATFTGSGGGGGGFNVNAPTDKTGGNGGSGVVVVRLTGVPTLRVDSILEENVETIIADNHIFEANTWTHVSVVQHRANTVVYLNGVTQTVTGNITQGYSSGGHDMQLGIGSYTFFDGFITNLKLVKGQALYLDDFTPSYHPLTKSAVDAISTGTGDTMALIANDSQLINYSGQTTNKHWYMRFFGKNAVEFDMPVTIGRNKFTMELWAYTMVDYGHKLSVPLVSINSQDGTEGTYLNIMASVRFEPYQNTDENAPMYYRGTPPIDNAYGYGGNPGLIFPTPETFSGGLRDQYYPGPGQRIFNMRPFKWHHIALVRDDYNVLTFYVNGVAVYSASTNTEFNLLGNKITFGFAYGNENRYIGYISNFRLTVDSLIVANNGTNLYTPAVIGQRYFLPASEPLTTFKTGHERVNGQVISVIQPGQTVLLIGQDQEITDNASQQPYQELADLYPTFELTYTTTDNAGLLFAWTAPLPSASGPAVTAYSPFSVNELDVGSLYTPWTPTTGQGGQPTGSKIKNTQTTQLGHNDWTIELWAYSQKNNSYADVVLNNGGSGDGAITISIGYIFNQDKWVVTVGGSTQPTNSWEEFTGFQDPSRIGNGIKSLNPVRFNSWQHLLLAKKYNTTSGVHEVIFYVDGMPQGHCVVPGTVEFNGGDDWYIAGSGGGDIFSGFVSNLRVTKGQALVDGMFDVNHRPLRPNMVNHGGANASVELTGNVTLLTYTDGHNKRSNVFTDSSTINANVVPYYDSIYQGAFTPFPVTATQTWNPLINGGSIYFDGDRWLTTAIPTQSYNHFNLEHSPWTAEMWFNWQGTAYDNRYSASPLYGDPTNQLANVCLATVGNDLYDADWVLGFTPDGMVYTVVGSQYPRISSSGFARLDQWNHIALVANPQLEYNSIRFNPESALVPSHLKVEKDDQFVLDTAGFTIEAWVYFTTAGNKPIMSSGSGDGVNNWMLSLTGLSVTFYWNNTQTTNNAFAFSYNFTASLPNTNPDFVYNLTAKKWNHVAISYDGTMLRGYINGIRRGVPTGTPLTLTITNKINTLLAQPLWIGAYPGGSNAFYWNGGGWLSTVRFTNSAPVYTETDYDMTPATRPPSSYETASAGTIVLLTGHYRKITDHSGNDFRMVPHGSVTVSTINYAEDNYQVYANGLKVDSFFNTELISGNYRYMTIGSDSRAPLRDNGLTAVGFTGYHSQPGPASGQGGTKFNGYISNFRLTARALFKEDFTASGSALTASHIGHYTDSTPNERGIANDNITGYVIALQNSVNVGSLVDITGTSIVVPADSTDNSTAVVKYGTGSVFFNGLDDYFSILGKGLIYQYGSADFTVEFWAYFNDIYRNQTLYDTRSQDWDGGPYLKMYLNWDISRTILTSSSVRDLLQVSNTYTFTLRQNRDNITSTLYKTGTKVKIQPQDTSNTCYMEGTITSWVGTTMTVNVINKFSSNGYTSSDQWIIMTAGDVTLNVDIDDYTTMKTSTNPNAHQWYHIALVKHLYPGDTVAKITLYVDGISQVILPNNDVFLNAKDRPYFGMDSYQRTDYFAGYMDDIRITKRARYTTNFTPPQSPATIA
jgi:Concanavalin A-like lectin/glucanases superfamily